MKDLGGRGKLTNNMIDRLQNYYGIAVRQNVGDLAGMKKAILATLFHVSSSSKNNWHDHCPTGTLSWCRYQRDKATGQSTYKPGPGLPQKLVISHVKPIYSDLSQDSLLEKCLHGKTQNQNESFNATIWERLPKTQYVSLTQLRYGTYDAVSNFNIGRKSSVLTYEKLHMIPGRYTTKGCKIRNNKRLFMAAYKNTETAKKRRKVIRGKSKTTLDLNIEKEGSLYMSLVDFKTFIYIILGVVLLFFNLFIFIFIYLVFCGVFLRKQFFNLPAMITPEPLNVF